MRHLYSGKVRELYELPDGLLLLVATDRISAFDYVLDPPIPDKGKILTQLSLWWFGQLADIVPSHLVSAPVPAGFEGRAMVCRRLDMVPVECVARGYLTGSALTEYERDGQVCGVGLPPGLADGSRLPEPIFTPATKAPRGEHDQNITAAQVARELGRAADGTLLLADEVLTPDSSRFWPADRWQPGRRQPSFDKQYVRDWLTSPASGWDRNGPLPPPPLPAEVVDRTRQTYVEAYRRLTGLTWA